MSTKSISLGGKPVGPDAECFITFEAGPTHNGYESAVRLVRHAAAAKADAIKFQILDPDRLMANRSVMFSYGVLTGADSETTETVSEPLYDLMKRRALSRDEWRGVKKACDEVGIQFFATCGFADEIDFLVELKATSVKIASADLNHFPLIRHAARTGLCIQLDTGNGTLGEVERAVDIVRREGNESIVIHHCPSGYPARLTGVNLRVLQTLQQMFPYPIAYSDHSPGWMMDVAAIALGASMVEKTITEDRMTRSVEHSMSLEPAEMVQCVKELRGLRVAMGQARRIMTDAELEGRRSIRRSLYLVAPQKKGVRLADAAVEFKRPGFGLGPDALDMFPEARLKHDLEAGHLLTIEDLAF